MAELGPWMSPLLAGGVAAGVLAGIALRMSSARRGDLTQQHTEEVFDLRRAPLAAESVDVETMLGSVFEALRAEAQRRLTTIRVATPEGLLVRVDPAAFRHALGMLVRAAIDLSPCAAVLVTARPHGGRVEISVLADGPAEGEELLRTRLRDAETIVALHGGTVEIDLRPDGAVLRVRLPTVPARSHLTSSMPATNPRELRRAAPERPGPRDDLPPREVDRPISGEDRSGSTGSLRVHPAPAAASAGELRQATPVATMRP